MKNLLAFLIILLFANQLSAQIFNDYSIYDSYENYRESRLNQRRIDPETVNSLINELKEKKDFEITLLGYSLENRPIHSVKWGNGEVRVLLWSQMHGDESTATRALFDIFNFLSDKNNFSKLKELLNRKLTLYVIPMLNPDGAYRFKRRNALLIDLNRDAERLRFPESQILKAAQDSVKPQFGFNLHDQMKYYTAGNTFKSAAVSFLAPAFNYEKDLNDVRENTMKVIVDIKNTLEKFIPGHIGRYSDDFEPRAFGDNMVKWGTSSVLIESGWWKNDTEKQYVRKLNFTAILSALHSIASKSYEGNNSDEYGNIPENEKLLFDLILRNCEIDYNGKKYAVDIAAKRKEKELGGGKYYYEGSIEDVGDLSVFYGYVDIDCSGMTMHPGKVYDGKSFSISDFTEEKIAGLLSKGFTDILLQDADFNGSYSPLPINITFNPNFENKFDIDENPNFYLTENGSVRYVIVNGFLFDVNLRKGFAPNGIIDGK